MPTYKITSPDGRIVKLTGDKPPSNETILKVFSSLPPIEQKKGFLDRAGDAVSESGGVLPYLGDVGRAAGQELSDIGQAAKTFGRAGIEAYARNLAPFNNPPTPMLEGLAGLAKEGGQAVMKDPMLIPRGIGEEVIDTSRSFSDPFQKAKEKPIETAADLTIAGKLLKPVLKGSKKIANLGLSKLKSPETLSVEEVSGTKFEPVIKRLKSNEDIISKISPSRLKETAFRDQLGVNMQGNIKKLTDALVKEQQKGLTSQRVKKNKILSEYDKNIRREGYDGMADPPAIKAFKNRLTDKASLTVEDIFKERKQIDGKIKYDEFGNLKDMKDEVYFQLRDALSGLLKNPKVNKKYQKYRDATKDLEMMQGKKQKNLFKKALDPGAGADLSKSYSSLSSTQRDQIKKNIKELQIPGINKVRRDLDTQLRTLDTANDIFDYEKVFNEFIPAFRKGLPIESVIQSGKVLTLPVRQRAQRAQRAIGRLAPSPVAVKAATEISQRTPSGSYTKDFEQKLINQRRR